MWKEAITQAAYAGTRDAATDFRSNTAKLLVRGEPLDPEREAAATRMLKRKYHVEYRRIALCLISRDWAAYADAYNRTIKAALKKKYDHDVIGEAEKMLDVTLIPH